MDNKERLPYIEKYLVPNYYEILKFGGTSVRDEEEEIERMIGYFPGCFTKEQLRENRKRYNTQAIFRLVKKYFALEYGYAGSSIELSNSYQNTINSYVYKDKDTEEFLLHIDELFESTVMTFFLAMLKWSKDIENKDVSGECFLYILYLLNDVCIFGEMQELNANQVLMAAVNGDIQILQLAENCYWTIMAFTLAHEVAHTYLASFGKAYSEEHPEKEEYDADAIAYHIVLKIIMEETGEDVVLEDYTCMAPIMYMDFFDLYYYTDRVLYGTMIKNTRHPLPKKRKESLFAIINKEEYDFNNVEANHLYGGFLDAYDKYRTELLLKKHNGKLEKICRTERRERMREGD